MPTNVTKYRNIDIGNNLYIFKKSINQYVYEHNTLLWLGKEGLHMESNNIWCTIATPNNFHNNACYMKVYEDVPLNDFVFYNNNMDSVPVRGIYPVYGSTYYDDYNIMDTFAPPYMFHSNIVMLKFTFYEDMYASTGTLYWDRINAYAYSKLPESYSFTNKQFSTLYFVRGKIGQYQIHDEYININPYDATHLHDIGIRFNSADRTLQNIGISNSSQYTFRISNSNYDTHSWFKLEFTMGTLTLSNQAIINDPDPIFLYYDNSIMNECCPPNQFIIDDIIIDNLACVVSNSYVFENAFTKVGAYTLHINGHYNNINIFNYVNVDVHDQYPEFHYFYNSVLNIDINIDILPTFHNPVFQAINEDMYDNSHGLSIDQYGIIRLNKLIDNSQYWLLNPIISRSIRLTSYPNQEYTHSFDAIINTHPIIEYVPNQVILTPHSKAFGLTLTNTFISTYNTSSCTIPNLTCNAYGKTISFEYNSNIQTYMHYSSSEFVIRDAYGLSTYLYIDIYIIPDNYTPMNINVVISPSVIYTGDQFYIAVTPDATYNDIIHPGTINITSYTLLHDNIQIEPIEGNTGEYTVILPPNFVRSNRLINRIDINVVYNQTTSEAHVDIYQSLPKFEYIYDSNYYYNSNVTLTPISLGGGSVDRYSISDGNDIDYKNGELVILLDVIGDYTFTVTANNISGSHSQEITLHVNDHSVHNIIYYADSHNPSIPHEYSSELTFILEYNNIFNINSKTGEIKLSKNYTTYYASLGVYIPIAINIAAYPIDNNSLTIHHSLFVESTPIIVSTYIYDTQPFEPLQIDYELISSSIIWSVEPPQYAQYMQLHANIQNPHFMYTYNSDYDEHSLRLVVQDLINNSTKIEIEINTKPIELGYKNNWVIDSSELYLIFYESNELHQNSHMYQRDVDNFILNDYFAIQTSNNIDTNIEWLFNSKIHFNSQNGIFTYVHNQNVVIQPNSYINKLSGQYIISNGDRRSPPFRICLQNYIHPYDYNFVIRDYEMHTIHTTIPINRIILNSVPDTGILKWYRNSQHNDAYEYQNGDIFYDFTTRLFKSYNRLINKMFYESYNIDAHNDQIELFGSQNIQFYINGTPHPIISNFRFLNQHKKRYVYLENGNGATDDFTFIVQ